MLRRIGNHVVDVRPRNLVRLEHLERAGRDVEPQHVVGAGVLQPDLAVDVSAIRADLVDLHVRSVQLRRQAPRLKRLGLAIELRDAALKLHAEPQVLVPVEAHAENAGRRVGLQRRDRVLGDVSRLGIELAEDLFAEARVPRQPLGVDDHVVRLARALRQVVLGVDDLRRPPFRPRLRFQRVASTRPPLRLSVVRYSAWRRHAGAALRGRFLAAADPRRGQLLRHQREGERRIAGHAFDDGHHPVHVVARP